MRDYSIEVGVIVESITIDNTSIFVRLNVKGTSKGYRNFNKITIDEIRSQNLINGERARFLYASKDDWALKRYSTSYGMDRYLKRDE